MPASKVQLFMLLKAVVGAPLNELQRRHPDRMYCLKWKRGDKPENRGRTTLAPIVRQAIEWNQRAVIEMTLKQSGDGYEQKLVKLSLEKDGTAGVLSSNTLAECIVDAAAYVVGSKAQEFAFSMQLQNRSTHVIKLHIVFTSSAVSHVPTALASSAGDSSLAFSELASTRGSRSSVDSDAGLGDAGPLPSTEALLKMQEESERRRKAKGAVPEKECKQYHIRLGVRKAVGDAIRALEAKQPGAAYRLKYTPEGGKSLTTKMATVSGNTVLWDCVADVHLAFFHSKTDPEKMEKKKLTLAFEGDTSENWDDPTQLAIVSIDLTKYIRGAALEGFTDYAFPMLIDGKQMKVQISFHATPESSMAKPKPISREIKVRLRAAAEGRYHQAVRTIPISMPLKMLAKGLPPLDGKKLESLDVKFMRDSDVWTAKEHGLMTLEALGVNEGDILTIQVDGAAVKKPKSEGNDREHDVSAALKDQLESFKEASTATQATLDRRIAVLEQEKKDLEERSQRRIGELESENGELKATVRKLQQVNEQLKTSLLEASEKASTALEDARKYESMLRKAEQRVSISASASSKQIDRLEMEVQRLQAQLDEQSRRPLRTTAGGAYQEQSLDTRTARERAEACLHRATVAMQRRPSQTLSSDNESDEGRYVPKSVPVPSASRSGEEACPSSWHTPSVQVGHTVCNTRSRPRWPAPGDTPQSQHDSDDSSSTSDVSDVPEAVWEETELWEEESEDGDAVQVHPNTRGPRVAVSWEEPAPAASTSSVSPYMKNAGYRSR
eukprot:Sspe_Gene.91225::Locus_62696_Transcript_1_1_Confidence_1.000_Length_2376::g.91225::m.91225